MAIGIAGTRRRGMILLAAAWLWGCGGDDGTTADGDADAPPDEAGAEDGEVESDAETTDAPVVCGADEDCSDGTFCNGVERCLPEDPAADEQGCVRAAVATPCLAGQTCDETADRCLTACEVDPDADDDGHDAIECGGDDCDDGDARRAPGNVEVCDDENVDEDCDPTTVGDLDFDGDGFISDACCNLRPDGILRCGNDCNDLLRSVNPGAVETCNLIDDDCNGLIDEGVQVDLYVDEDGDLHGDPSRPVRGCPGTGRLSPVGDDCDDANPARHGAQPELCNGVDDDCDGETDEDAGAITWYRDADGDGFGDPAGPTVVSCSFVPGYSVLPTDCDDTRREVNPAAPEACDGLDTDCNGSADYIVGPGDFEDDDGDGVPDAACAGPSTLGDCDDNDPTVYPGAGEIVGDGVDNNCDGETDTTCTDQRWYVDADGDGFGTGTALLSCDPQPDRVTRNGDCDDDDPLRSPSAPEVCNGVDDDCDGITDGLEADRSCYYAHALGACAESAGVYACRLVACEAGRANCNGDPSDSCEADLRTDAYNCGACGAACPFGPFSTPVCSFATCSLACATLFGDCDGVLENGCEANLATDPLHCGSCATVCPDRYRATPTCSTGTCGLTCEDGWADCDAVSTNGCEVNLARDVAHCGGCGTACDASAPICTDLACREPPFLSDGSEGAFAPTADTVLAPGIHQFTTINIPLGVRVTTSGPGVLELYASGEVRIAGIIDVSGANGGVGVAGVTGGGGATANPFGVGATGGAAGTCNPAGSGGTGGAGGRAVGSPASCGEGGNRGGGAGAAVGYGGGGGGGYAGGGGGASYLSRAGGAGGAAAGGVGGAGGILGGFPGSPCPTDPLGALGGEGTGVYAGEDASCGENYGAGGGGGGAIGADAEADPAVASTFRPGSAGGGGGGGYAGPTGGGGGGAGGAVRIASAMRIQLAAWGEILVDGGDGAEGEGGGGGGGGGSGGVIFLSAPTMELFGTLSATGGGGAERTQRTYGGNGGLGRIRLSVLPEECNASGSFAPALAGSVCDVTPGAGTPGSIYIARFPN
jgi:hypothetical protein